MNRDNPARSIAIQPVVRFLTPASPPFRMTSQRVFRCRPGSLLSPTFASFLDFLISKFHFDPGGVVGLSANP
jgi:hypothetical protein